MADKPADIQTLAPRLSYVEDLAAWLKDNCGEGGSGGVDQKLWKATLTGAVAGGTWGDEPWQATDLIYGPGSTNEVPMHQTVFGNDATGALRCQDGKGLYGWVFPVNETRWQYGPENRNANIAGEIFGSPTSGYVHSLRAAGLHLMAAVFKSPEYIGEYTIVDRVNDQSTELESLATNFETEAEDDVFKFDLRGFTRDMSRIEKQILPTAQAGFLNGLAFGARKGLLQHVDKVIEGKPTAWTKRGFLVDKATPESLEATVRIQPQQTGYMTYLIDGGIRRAGDVGATRYDVLTDAPDDQKNAFGNLKRGYLKRIARQARVEKTKRARLAAKREKLRKSGQPTAPASWAATNPGRPGIFFGTIDGKKGYWQRAAKRDGDYRLKLLARMSDEAAYKPSFRWDDTIAASVEGSDPAKLYSAEITRALRKLNGS